MKNVILGVIAISLPFFSCLLATQVATQSGTIEIDESSLVTAEYITLAGETVEVCEHAFIGHRGEVLAAIESISNCGEPCRYQCTDGRVRYANRVKIGNTWRWAIVVRHGLHGKVITAFFASQDYVRKMLTDNGCDNGFGAAHP